MANKQANIHESLWLATTSPTAYPALAGDVDVDVAIVGGGIAGLTSALLLTRAGQRVAVLEADRIVKGVTAYTTAKLTSLHTLIYDRLTRELGRDAALSYGTANQAAVDLVAALVDEYGIDCDFSRTSAYTYTESTHEIDAIEAEVTAAHELGLPAHLTTNTPLPFPVAAAVRFDNQAQFHPRKYLLAVAQQIVDAGSHIFEKTKAVDVKDGTPCEVATPNHRVRARAVIVASHFPCADNAFYFARMAPHFSYLMAMTLNEPVPEGMFIRTDSAHTLRRHVGDGRELLLVGGEGHKTGQGGDTEARYQRIEAWAREHFAVAKVHYRWATQDYQTPDGVPYIGKMAPTTEHLYVATGFKGWGMSNGTAAALLLTDLVLGRENPWVELFNPNRISFSGVKELAQENLNVAKEFAKGLIAGGDAETLAPGEGGLVNGPEGREARYRADDGTLYRLSPICPHMGCAVNWNPAERSWDCPCHGSRFAADGRVIHGPTLSDLPPIA